MKAFSLGDYIAYTRGDEERRQGGSEGSRKRDQQSVISKRPKAERKEENGAA
jgi:hypothetical protein